MSRRSYIQNVFETTLAGAISAGDTVLPLTSVTNLRQPGHITINPDSNVKREIISYATINGSNIEGCVRGLSGSAAGAQNHDSGSIVRGTMYHQVVDDVFSDIEDLETDVADHVGGTDTADHPEATTTVRGFMSPGDKTKLNGIEAGATADQTGPEILTALGATMVARDLAHTRVYRTAALFVPASTWTWVPFGAEVTDDLGWHSVSVNPERITVDANGLYIIAATVAYEGNETGDIRIATLKKNTTNAATSGINTELASQSHAAIKDRVAGPSPRLQLSTPVRLSAGDWVSVATFHDVPGGLNTEPNLTMMSVTRMSVE